MKRRMQCQIKYLKSETAPRSPRSALHAARCARSGQSLIEVLVAIVVGTIMVIGALSIITPVLKGNTDVVRTQTSTALGKDLLDSVRVFAEADWHNLTNLATSSVNAYFINSAASPFVAVTGTESVVLDVSTSSVATSSLVGYWKLDESTGTTAYNYSGGGYNGILTGGPTAISSCQIGGCLNFNGSSGYVNVSSSWEFGSDYTISVWIKTASSTVEAPVVSNRDGNGKVYFGVLNGKAFLYQNNCVPAGFTSNTTVTDGQFHLVTFVRQGSPVQGQMYVDGSIDNSNSPTGCAASNGNSLQIGHDVSNATEYFSGWVDDVRIYNRALSADEVAQLYKDTVYTRYFYVDDAYRDVSGNIAVSGTLDPSTKKVTTVFGWQGGATSTFVTYLTRSFNKILWQTDWAGGSGQDGPATTTNSKFSTSSNINFTTSTGSVIINL